MFVVLPLYPNVITKVVLSRLHHFFSPYVTRVSTGLLMQPYTLFLNRFDNLRTPATRPCFQSNDLTSLLLLLLNALPQIKSVSCRHTINADQQILPMITLGRNVGKLVGQRWQRCLNESRKPKTSTNKIVKIKRSFYPGRPHS